MDNPHRQDDKRDQEKIPESPEAKLGLAIVAIVALYFAWTVIQHKQKGECLVIAETWFGAGPLGWAPCHTIPAENTPKPESALDAEPKQPTMPPIGGGQPI